MRLRLMLAQSALALILFASPALAAKISGRITDASNGKPVVFATVRLLEVGMVAHTDADGRYVFDGVPAGRHTVAVSFANYTDYSIGVVETAMEGQKTLDAALQPDIAPIYHRDNDPSLSAAAAARVDHRLHQSPIRISDIPIRGYEDYIAIQPGTVRRFYGAPVHVRGGRIEEFTYDVDGFSQQDPFTGRSFTAINGNTIDEVSFFSGFSGPENGWTASGHAEVKTKETWATGGSVEVITDNFHGEKSDYNLYALDLSGPLLSLTAGQLTYAVAGEYRTFGTREVGGPDDWNYLGAWHANLRWRPTDRTSAMLGTRGSYEDWKYTPRAWYFNSEHAPRGVDENYSVFGRIQHQVSPRAHVTVTANWVSVAHVQGDGVHFRDLWAYGRPFGNRHSDQTALFTSWDDSQLDPDSLSDGRHVRLLTPIEESTFTVELSDGSLIERSFVIRGDEATVWDDLVKQKGSYVGGSVMLDLVHSRAVHGRLGLEIESHTARAYHHLFPVNVYQGANGGFGDIDRFGYDQFGEETSDTREPYFLAGFIAERIELAYMTLDLGARWDHFDYNTMGLVDPSKPLDPFDESAFADTASGLTDDERNDLRVQAQKLEVDELVEVDPIDRLSPRFSAKIPIGSETGLHFTGSRLIQRPPLQSLYLDYDYLEYKVRTGGYSYSFGNPTLAPTGATLFEASLSHRFPNVAEVHVAAYTKRYEHVSGPTTQPATPNDYQTLTDFGSVTIRGVELSAQIMPVSGVTAQLAYSATDISDDDQSYAYTSNNIAWTSWAPPRIRAPFTFEQEHRLVGILDLRTGPHSGVRVGTSYPLANSGITLLFEAGSGFPYSPVAVHNEVTLGQANPAPTGSPGSIRTPTYYRLDLKVNKTVTLVGVDLEAYLWIINVFDRENVAYVYRGTGQPDYTGWLETPEGHQFVQDFAVIHDASFLTGEQKYQLRQNDPANFDIPRQIRFGMRVGF